MSTIPNKHKGLGQNKPASEEAGKAPDKQLRFPSRLHYVLTELEGDGLADIISWEADGTSFRIHDKDRVEKEVIPL